MAEPAGVYATFHNPRSGRDQIAVFADGQWERHRRGRKAGEGTGAASLALHLQEAQLDELDTVTVRCTRCHKAGAIERRYHDPTRPFTCYACAARGTVEA